MLILLIILFILYVYIKETTPAKLDVVAEVCPPHKWIYKQDKLFCNNCLKYVSQINQGE